MVEPSASCQGLKVFVTSQSVANEKVVLSSSQGRWVNLSKTNPQFWLSSRFTPNPGSRTENKVKFSSKNCLIHLLQSQVMRIISQKWSLNMHFWMKGESGFVELFRWLLYLSSVFCQKVNRNQGIFLVFLNFDENWPSCSKDNHIWKFWCGADRQTSSTKKLILLSDFSPTKFEAQRNYLCKQIQSHKKQHKETICTWHIQSHKILWLNVPTRTQRSGSHSQNGANDCDSHRN